MVYQLLSYCFEWQLSSAVELRGKAHSPTLSWESWRWHSGAGMVEP